jgi:hypothetical protein
MRGNVGTCYLTDEQKRVLDPKAYEVNSLIESLIAQCQLQERDANSILSRLIPALAEKAGIRIKLVPITDEEMSARRAGDSRGQ